MTRIAPPRDQGPLSTEEHRSSILGTVWAKGERQTVTDAKEYLSSKLSEGVLDDSQIEALYKVVDSYTIRR